MYQFPLVRRQGNSSFANKGCVSARAVCKCAVLCVGCFSFSVFCSKIFEVFGFFRLVANKIYVFITLTTNEAITWLKDKSLADLDNLPDPETIAKDIIENLEAGLESFREMMVKLNLK
jgi:hypothetical protein